MRNRMYGGVRGRKMKVGGKLLHFPPTRFLFVRLLIQSNLHEYWVVVGIAELSFVVA